MDDIQKICKDKLDLQKFNVADQLRNNMQTMNNKNNSEPELFLTLSYLEDACTIASKLKTISRNLEVSHPQKTISHQWRVWLNSCKSEIDHMKLTFGLKRKIINARPFHNWEEVVSKVSGMSGKHLQKVLNNTHR
eukprot:UN18586